jgi:hypothetical protein
MLSTERGAMLLLRLTFFGVLVFSVWTGNGQRATSKAGEPRVDIPSSTQSTIPFSATRYWREIMVLSDGRSKFLRHLRHPAAWARDAEGRVRIQTIEFEGECDQPTKLVPAECDQWAVDVFDPTNQTITGWLEGRFAADITIIVPLTSEEVAELLATTSEFPTPAALPDDPSIDTLTVDLGEKEIDGISAHGIRTTYTYPAGYQGRKSTSTRIHEVWKSPNFEIPVREIDGDPKGKEIVRGLEKISLTPDPSLFKEPENYSLQRPTQLDPAVKSVYLERFVDFYSN